MKRIVLFSVLALSSLHSEDRLRILTIPGQNGLGSEEHYLYRILDRQQILNIARVPTPPGNAADLGQNKCMVFLRFFLKNRWRGTDNQNCIIHASSQGTATALNVVAHEDEGRQVKALILEAALVSGNSAIEHTVKNCCDTSLERRLACLPFSHYWMPYIAKAIAFPNYWPAGKQPIKSIDQIPTDLPIIIAHSTNDPQLAYTDACALYYALRAQGNQNAYLITKEGCEHLWLLLDSTDIIQAILRKHGLSTAATTRTAAIDVRVYQPDHMPFKKYYDELRRKERNHERIAYASIAGISATMLWGLRSLMQKNMLGSK